MVEKPSMNPDDVEMVPSGENTPILASVELGVPGQPTKSHITKITGKGKSNETLTR